MAGHGRYTALLDACVLYQMGLTDLLITFGRHGLYAPKWSEVIENEWLDALSENRSDLTRTKLVTRRDAMRRAIPDWEVDLLAIERLSSSLTLPDCDDRHVLAAAIVGHADCIVTFNRKDFPLPSLAPYGLEAIHPDDFLVAQLDLSPFHALSAVKQVRQRSNQPAYSADEFLSKLEGNGLTQFADRLAEARELI